jgi:glycosyltransferase involved in cell wall biosynthesis
MATGGVERTTVEVASAIIEAGGRALVFSAGGRLVPELEAIGAEHISGKANSKHPWTVFVSNPTKLAQLIGQEKVDIVHARSRAPAWSALLAARRTHTPFVTTYHGIYNAKSGLKRWYNSVMARGDRVIANVSPSGCYHWRCLLRTTTNLTTMEPHDASDFEKPTGCHCRSCGRQRRQYGDYHRRAHGDPATHRCRHVGYGQIC